MQTCLLDIWKNSADLYGEKTALTDFSDSVSISYTDAYHKILYFAKIFKEMGIKNGDRVCIFSQASPYWLLIDQAIVAAGGISVAKNPQNINELRYIFENCSASALVCDDIDIINNLKVFDKIKFILFLGLEKVENISDKIIYLSEILKNEPKETEYSDDMGCVSEECSIIYTSGTSSLPKGAVHTNYGIVSQIAGIRECLRDNKFETFLSAIHPASVGSKIFNLFAVSIGCKVVYTPYKLYFENIKKFKPELFLCLPKMAMTMKSKIQDYIKSKGILYERLFGLNFKISDKLMHIKRKIGFLEKLCNFILKLQDILIYKEIRNLYFNDNNVLCIGSASFAKNAEDFYQVIGVNVVQDYGMTEAGLVTHSTILGQKKHPYTVGKPFAHVKFKIVNPETYEELKPEQKGLLMIKSPSVLKEYYNNIEATEKVKTSDGWFMTGDIACADKDNYISILSRADDVIVMMNGYDVFAPQIQNQINISEYVLQSVVAGHGKPYLVALISLDFDKYIKWCEDNKIEKINPNNNRQFKEFFLGEINHLVSLKEHYHYYEQIKKVYFIDEKLTEENGCLTYTLKLRYKKVLEKFSKVVENLYEG